MKRLITAALTASALVLAACGSTPEGSGDEDTTASARDMGPLAEYMGWADFDQEAGEDDWQQKQVEQLTATCMKEEGFEYKPVDNNQGYEDPNAAAYELWGTREFAEKYGYGISMNRAAQNQMQNQSQEWVDPNQEYVDAMSESEKVAYYDALWGPGAGLGMAMTSAEAVPAEAPSSAAEATDSAETSADAAATDGSESSPTESTESAESAEPAEPTEIQAEPSMSAPSPEEMGCSGRANAEVYPQAYLAPDDEMNQMWEELDRRRTALEDTPELTKATEEWSNCLADEGFPGLTEPMNVQQDLTEELAKLYGETYTDMGDGGYSIEGPEEPVTPDPADLEAFKQKEISQAVADFDCSVDMVALRQKLQFEMEEKFIEEYGAVLDRQRELENG